MTVQYQTKTEPLVPFATHLAGYAMSQDGRYVYLRLTDDGDGFSCDPGGQNAEALKNEHS